MERMCKPKLGDGITIYVLSDIQRSDLNVFLSSVHKLALVTCSKDAVVDVL